MIDLVDIIKKYKTQNFIEKTKNCNLYTKNLESLYVDYLNDLLDFELKEKGKDKSYEKEIKQKLENTILADEIMYAIEYAKRWDKEDANEYDYYLEHIQNK